jgi:hypothetical protein
MRKLVLLALMALCLRGAESGGLTGNVWRTLPLSGRQLYMAGFAYGYTSALSDMSGFARAIVTTKAKKIEGKPSIAAVAADKEIEETNRQLWSCWERPPAQLTAIVDKYIENNPEIWHEALADLVKSAVTFACAPQLIGEH